MKQTLFFLFMVAIIAAISCMIGVAITGFFAVPQNAGTITVGAILPLTGTNARYGELEMAGIEMALLEINESGGINGKKIMVEYEDSQASQKQSINAWRKIKLDSNVQLVISGLSPVCMALRPIANSDRTILLATDCSAAQYSSSQDYSFRITNSNAIEGEQMAKLLLEEGINSAAVLKINNDYGEGLFPAFEKAFIQGNGKITVFQSYSPQQRDFSTELTKIKESNAKAIYLISYAPDAEIIVKQIKELGIEKPVFAAEPIENNDFLKNAGKTAEGIVYLKAVLSGKKGDEFSEKAKTMLGRYPEINIARAFEAMHIAATAMKACDSQKQSDSECIKRQLYSGSFDGVLGKITFDSKGDVSIPYAKKKIKDGQFTVCGKEC